jgi:threonine aldolase
MKQAIDYRSDTLTKPSPEMLQAMMEAELGDDVWNEDPTVQALEQKAAAMFGMEAGLFCPSGTMTNQIAIKVHTQPGQEVICDIRSHIYNYEGGGIAFNSGCSVRLLNGDRGRLTAGQIEENINPDDIHFPPTALVSLENTVNKGGGSYYQEEALAEISALCKKHKLPLHLDGARLCNALVASGQPAGVYGKYFDSISLCLSKGLGAPVGSVLLGNKDHIKQARRIRKAFGGGMRQAGLLAAAGIYALDHNIDRLADDYRRAKVLGEALAELDYVESTEPVDTNIVLFNLKDESSAGFVERLQQKGVKAGTFGPKAVRLVTHLHITDADVDQTIEALKKM